MNLPFKFEENSLKSGSDEYAGEQTDRKADRIHKKHSYTKKKKNKRKGKKTNRNYFTCNFFRGFYHIGNCH